MSECVLSCRDLTKTLNTVPVTNGVSFDVWKDHVHALIGSNGAGKTSLLSQICGDTIPDRGSILFQGREITHLPVHARARLGISRSFQNPQLFDTLSVFENILLALRGQSRSVGRAWSCLRGDDRFSRQCGEILSAVHLSGKSQVRVDSLSRGEQRRLDVAVAFAGDAALIVLDEPLAGLGYEDKERMVDMIHRLGRHRTVLLVEHDIDAVSILVDRVSVLHSGRIVMTGSFDEVRAWEHPGALDEARVSHA